jgi:membrane carboxypeptidase/penicillin-binding protein PbpC
MDAVSISKALEGRKTGAFFSIKMKRPAKLLAAFKNLVVDKESTMTGQLDYSARAAVKNAVADGERAAPELPSHIKESFMVGNVKFWRGNTDKVYLPMPLSGAKPKVQWYLDGEPCDKADVEMYLQASEKSKPQDKEELADKGQVPFVGISVENILEVH